MKNAPICPCLAYNSAAKLPTCAVSTSFGSILVASSAPKVASRIIATKCLPSFDQLRAKSVCAPPNTYTGAGFVITRSSYRSIFPNRHPTQDHPTRDHPTNVRPYLSTPPENILAPPDAACSTVAGTRNFTFSSIPTPFFPPTQPPIPAS